MWLCPVNGGGGDAGTLNTTTDTISQSLNLPTNVERVYLDVIAQSQSNDEFWYFCVPNDQTSNLESCGNTAFRETEIWIDGKPAGVAPVYPWIYTGGIDPYLWEPIPGVQTLDFKPYRVDLTPFAGVLSDGNTHTVAVSVYNANSYFLATANLLVFEDHGASKVTGGLLSNTLTEPNPVVQENIDYRLRPDVYRFGHGRIEPELLHQRIREYVARPRGNDGGSDGGLSEQAGVRREREHRHSKCAADDDTRLAG